MQLLKFDQTTDMIFILASFIVPIVIYFFFPLILQKFSGKNPTSRWPLLVGGFLYFIAWYLPSFEIHGKNTGFVTHLLGGVSCGFFWIYAKEQLQLKFNSLFDLILLYAVVSSLGVANELFELVAHELKLTRITGFDTWWDLTANTSGALTFWLVWSASKYLKK